MCGKKNHSLKKLRPCTDTEMFVFRNEKELVTFQATEQLQTATIKNKNTFPH